MLPEGKHSGTSRLDALSFGTMVSCNSVPLSSAHSISIRNVRSILRYYAPDPAYYSGMEPGHAMTILAGIIQCILPAAMYSLRDQTMFTDNEILESFHEDQHRPFYSVQSGHQHRRCRCVRSLNNSYKSLSASIAERLLFKANAKDLNKIQGKN